ncbi:MAG: protein kinase [Pseudomonadota bacterium]
MPVCVQCGSQIGGDGMICAACGAPSAAGPKSLVGTLVLGVYEISAVLGRGGMSVVYKARHRMTEQTVALKILPAELAAHPAIRARFLDEGKALARLEHPRIVRLYHFGEEHGRFVLAMQYVEGLDLEKKILRSGGIPWREVARVSIDVLDALEFAHSRSIVHRDIKPSNVLVKPDNSAMVMDFGIARMSERTTRLTGTGQTMGTVRYMSPEQVRGLTVGPQSDLYSLGVAMFEAVSGKTPFDGATQYEILSQHLTAAPPALRSRGIDIPEALEAVIMRALRKRPHERFGDAAEFRSALEALLEIGSGELKSVENRGDGLTEELPQGQPPIAVSGIASALEPVVEPPKPASAPSRSKGLVLGISSAVLAAALGIAGFAWWRYSLVVVGAANGSSSEEKEASPWPEPLIIPGLSLTVDKTFAGSEQVRIISARSLDAGELAHSYATLRDELVRRASRFLSGDAGIEVQVRPLNLVVVENADTLCHPDLWNDGRPPAQCKLMPAKYVPARSTLYTPSTKKEVLAYGTAFHLCYSSSGIWQGNKGDCSRFGNRLLSPPVDADVPAQVDAP